MNRDLGAGKAVQNVLFGGLRLALSAGATICTSTIIARRLGPSNMGVFGYAMWIVGTIGAFANIGLPVATTKYISEYIGRGQRATAACLGKKLLIAQSAIAAIAAGLTACFMVFPSPYRGMIGLAAILLFVQALQQGLNAALAGLQRFDSIALIALYVALAQVASVGTAALLHAGVAGMLWATLAGSVIGTALSYRKLSTLLLKSQASASSAVPEMAAIYSRIKTFLPTMSYILILNVIVWQRSEILFLKWYSGLSQIAFYTLAYSLAAKLNDISAPFADILLPLYSESYGRDAVRQVGSIYVKASKYLQIIMVFPCFLAAILSKPLVNMVYGSAYGEVVLPLQLLLVSVAFTSLGTAASPLLVSTDGQSFIAKYGTVVAVVNIALDCALIPRHGAVGAAVANCAAQILGVLGGTLYTVRYARAKFPWRSIATIYCTAGVALLPVVYCISATQSGVITVAGSVAASATLYLGLLSVAGELAKSDFEVLRVSLSANVKSPAPLESVDVA
jgi:O-antigen/teichoic acid export membrane protein